MLKRVKPIFEELDIKQAQKLAAFYGGYAAFAYMPLLACISIMTERAKRKIKDQIDCMAANTQEQLQQATYYAKELVECYGIRQGDNVKLRGGWQSVWYDFEKKTKSSLYCHALRMAALVLTFPVWNLKDYELDLLMEYAFFLNDTRQREILISAKEQLAAGEIQSPHIIEEIKPFLSETMKEEEILERHFNLDVAAEVYDL